MRRDLEMENPEMDNLAKISLGVASLASLAALLNGATSLFSYWRDTRRLQISLVPNEFGKEIASVSNEYPFDLKIVNPAKSANAIREVSCFVDATRQPLSAEPVDLWMKPIEGYSSVGGYLELPAQKVEGEYECIKFVFVPIRGPRRTFRFQKKDLLAPS
jgi:hypothetical protein